MRALIAPNGGRANTGGGGAMLNRRMTASHPLDRPVWSALTTRQADRADGGPLALRFAPRFGLFAASIDGSAQSLAALHALIPPGG